MSKENSIPLVVEAESHTSKIDEAQEEELTEAQLFDLAKYFKISTENKSSQDLEEEIDREAESFFNSDQGRQIKTRLEKTYAGFMDKIATKFKWLKIALAAMPLITGSLPAVAWGQEPQGQKYEQKDVEKKPDFHKFFAMWSAEQSKSKKGIDFEQAKKDFLEYILQKVQSDKDDIHSSKEIKEDYLKKIKLKEVTGVTRHPKFPEFYGVYISIDDGEEESSAFLILDSKDSSIRVFEPFPVDLPEDERPSLGGYWIEG